ncbi:MAG TPA: hypothetical protein VND65_06505 [Candidatus Binatia bacterium]|nr:hypothetical protein [Candidatus Binatia bacterium]
MIQGPRTSGSKRQRHPIYAAEATGLILIAFVLLLLIVIRYWRAIHWSWW